MYRCEDLKITEDWIEAPYWILYVWINALIDDANCKTHCILDNIEDCNIIKALNKILENKKKLNERDKNMKDLNKISGVQASMRKKRSNRGPKWKRSYR